MTSNSEESSLWNLTLRPTAAAFSSSDLTTSAAKLRIGRASEQFDRQVTKHGGFGAIALVHRDPSCEYTDLLDFIFFLENHKINVTRGDVIQKSAAQPIGVQGQSMEVFKGTYYGQPVALKYLRRSRLPDTAWKTSNRGEYNHLLEVQRSRQRDVLFECKIMACNFLSQHRNIVKLLGVFFEDDEVLPDENNIFVPVMIVELADQRFPDLNSYIASNDRPKPIAFEDAAGLISDIADGISALHLYGIIHADIKPGNILLFPEAGTDKLIAKIADFGFSGIITSDDNARGGTAYWNAPEIIMGVHTSNSGGYKVEPSHSYRDIYSFGLVSMLIALDGRWPIDPEESRKLKLNDRVTQAIATKLRKEDASLCWTADQQALFIWLAEGTLRLKPEDRWSSLAGVRVALTGKCVHLSHSDLSYVQY
jgi:serine/threonine protein kinase